MLPFGMHRHRPPRANGGFSLVEVSVSTLIVGLLLVSALKSAGMQARSQGIVFDQARGWLLAQDLLAEILAAEVHRAL